MHTINFIRYLLITTLLLYFGIDRSSAQTIVSFTPEESKSNSLEPAIKENYQINKESPGFTEAEKEWKALNRPEQREYNNHAMRKIKAFKIYLSNVLNPHLSYEHRQESLDFAMDLFVDANIVIHDTLIFSLDGQNRDSVYYLEELLNKALKFEVTDIEFDWDYLNSYETENFKSTIKTVDIEQVLIQKNGTNTENTKKSKKLIEAYFTVEEKDIFKEKIKVNQIKLGNILFNNKPNENEN